MSVTHRIRTAASSVGTTSVVESLEGRALFTGVSGSYGLLEGIGNVRTGTVVSSSAKDSYKFHVNNTSIFDASLVNTGGDGDLYLYASNHTTVLASSTHGGTVTDNIVGQSLSAGDYYIDVIPFSGTSNYSLRSVADPTGDTFAAARSLGNIGSTKTLRDGVGNDGFNAADTDDYYKFTVQQPGTVTLKLTNMTADGDLYLYDASQAYITSSTAGGSTSETITKTLQPGVYYARATKFSTSFTNYTFSYSGPVDAAGNNRSTAKSFGAVPPTRTQNDFVGDFDPDDFYKFTVSAGKTIHLVLNGLAHNADLALQKSDGTLVKVSSHTGTTSETIDYKATSSGTFYARVYRIGSDDTAYKLTIS